MYMYRIPGLTDFGTRLREHGQKTHRVQPTTRKYWNTFSTFVCTGEQPWQRTRAFVL